MLLPMRAPLRLGFVLLLLLPAAAEAATVEVPEQVLSTNVPFAVNGAASGATVNLTVGLVSKQYTSATSADVFTVPGVATGWQAWAARVTSGGTSETFSGRVYVDPAVSSLTSSMAALAVQVAELEAALDDLNATQGNVTALQLRMNHTLNQMFDALLAATTGGANLEANVTEAMRKAANEVLLAGPIQKDDVTQLTDESRSASVQANRAASWGLYATLAAAACILLTILLGLFLFKQLQQTRGDFLVYVLALAAHSGITPQSPEFQQALAATGHKPKEPKEKKSRKEKLKGKKGKDEKAGG